ncbi:MAG: superoxide dismutase, partial [Bacteroidales bacterium]|nr:superoxide dismutase [Bacteroidales bacterium]
MKDLTPNNGIFEMPKLSYSALGDVISKETLLFHHGKHLKAYVDNLNKLLPGSGLENMPLAEVVKRSEGAIFNNAGQVLNHVMYFEQFNNSNHEPAGKIKEL